MDIWFQHTAARRRLGSAMAALRTDTPVSTHSRPKAAGAWRDTELPESLFQHTAARRRLGLCPARCRRRCGFNTQPPEGGWVDANVLLHRLNIVSTHSRPKAAGSFDQLVLEKLLVSTHSRPKAAGIPVAHLVGIDMVSTHSRPKAAGHNLPLKFE